jgi:hypothetical protein
MPDRNGKPRRGSNGSRGQPANDTKIRLHDLKNTLASLRLRLGIVAGDPTCRWAQEENLTAMLAIVTEALAQLTALDQTLPNGTAAPPRAASERPLRRARR